MKNTVNQGKTWRGVPLGNTVQFEKSTNNRTDNPAYAKQGHMYQVDYHTGAGNQAMKAETDEQALREADAGITNTRANVTVITSTHANVTVITPDGTTYVREWNGSRDGFDKCVRPVWFPDGYYADWYETLPNGTGYGHVAVDGNMVVYID